LLRRDLTSVPVRPGRRRPDRRVLELPGEPRLRRAPDRLRGGPDAAGGLGGHAAGGGAGSLVASKVLLALTRDLVVVPGSSSYRRGIQTSPFSCMQRPSSR